MSQVEASAQTEVCRQECRAAETPAWAWGRHTNGVRQQVLMCTCLAILFLVLPPTTH